MKTYRYYISFGDKKFKTLIKANNRDEADKLVRDKLKIDKVEEAKDDMDDINNMFEDVFHALCSNPLHKHEVKIRGFCSRCKGNS